MQEALQRLPRMYAPHTPGRGTRGSDQGAADACRKLQRPPDGHVRNHRQVRSDFLSRHSGFRHARVRYANANLRFIN